MAGLFEGGGGNNAESAGDGEEKMEPAEHAESAEGDWTLTKVKKM